MHVLNIYAMTTVLGLAEEGGAITCTSHIVHSMFPEMWVVAFQNIKPKNIEPPKQNLKKGGGFILRVGLF